MRSTSAMANSRPEGYFLKKQIVIGFIGDMEGKLGSQREHIEIKTAQRWKQPELKLRQFPTGNDQFTL